LRIPVLGYPMAFAVGGCGITFMVYCAAEGAAPNGAIQTGFADHLQLG
jgi:TRAP-type mannitol/chloroaromatic compound transport system permease large subunit